MKRENEVIHILNLTFNHISMQFVNKVLREMKQMSTEELEAAKVKLKSTFTFYWKITQEEGIDLSRPRGKSAPRPKTARALTRPGRGNANRA